MKYLLTVISCLLFYSNINAQILDVPYKSDLQVNPGNWCWAKSSQMIIVYYGSDIHLCDVLEYARTQRPTFYGSENCCDNPYDSCDNGGCFYSSYFTHCENGILGHWSIPSTHDQVLTLSEIQTNLSLNRPFICQQINANYSGHSVVCYGLNGNDLYIHNPGNGSEIKEYYEYTDGDPSDWYYTLFMNISATNCLYSQHITGGLNSTNSIYKAQQSIIADCNIYSSSSVTFRSGNYAVLNSGFSIEMGSSLVIETGCTITCP